MEEKLIEEKKVEVVKQESPQKRSVKNVAIVGYTSTREQAPFNDPEFEIWGLNDLYDLIPRYTRWFEMHSRGPMVDGWKSHRTNKEHIEVLRSMECPVYMQEKFEDIPSSVAYPLEQMIREFGQYFTNSISYMLALAIHEGFEEIHIYGVDMAWMGEYSGQRPSCEYFIGIAIGRGIRIHIPDQSDLLKARFFYGYGQESEDLFKKKLKQILADLDVKTQNAAGQELTQRDLKNQYIGAKNGIKEMIQVWGTLE